MLIFPEGTRSTDGLLQTFKVGLGLLTSETPVAIIPTRIEGTHAAMPKGARLPRRCPIHVSFGKALDPGSLPEDPDAPAYERYRRIVDSVRHSIEGLAGADARSGD